MEINNQPMSNSKGMVKTFKIYPQSAAKINLYIISNSNLNERSVMILESKIIMIDNDPTRYEIYEDGSIYLVTYQKCS